MLSAQFYLLYTLDYSKIFINDELYFNIKKKMDFMS